jgi:hypothetical protein
LSLGKSNTTLVTITNVNVKESICVSEQTKVKLLINNIIPVATLKFGLDINVMLYIYKYVNC